MKNQYKVYSLIILIIIIVGILIYIYTSNKKELVYEQVIEKDTTSTKNDATDSPSPTVISKEELTGISNEDAYFSSHTDSENNTSNVVGYFAGGAFYTYVPDWMAQNWRVDSSDSGSKTIFTPNKPSPIVKDLSDIVIEVQATTEDFNAEWLFESNKKGALVAEVILNTEGDMRIYHIEKKSGTDIKEVFYIDGNDKTGIFTFSANQENYYRYNVKVKEFIQGLRKNVAARG